MCYGQNLETLTPQEQAKMRGEFIEKVRESHPTHRRIYAGLVGIGEARILVPDRDHKNSVREISHGEWIETLESIGANPGELVRVQLYIDRTPLDKIFQAEERI